MSKTKAELERELEALKEQNERLRAANNRGARERYACPLWTNPNKTDDPNDKRPEWTGSARLVIPKGAKPGDPFYVDFSLWEYIDGVSPGNYSGNPPVFSGSISPSSPAWAHEQELKREEALRERGQIH